MTVTRLTLAASRWAWLLPLALAELSAGCGSSSSTVGESAGAPGASAGTAGVSSTHGGASTGSGGSSAGHAGAAGSNTSGGGVSEVGGASGSSNQGGASAGGACTTDADCGAGFNCLYKIADGCTAKGGCFKEPGGVLCMSVSPYCGCSGEVVGVPCYEPAGYAPEPVSSKQAQATCPVTPDAVCDGKSCGDACGTGEFGAWCDVNGQCLMAEAPNCP